MLSELSVLEEELSRATRSSEFNFTAHQQLLRQVYNRSLANIEKAPPAALACSVSPPWEEPWIPVVRRS